MRAKNQYRRNQINTTPKETLEQQAIVEWARLQLNVYPELEMLFAIPNGGSRNIIEAVNLKREGTKAGVSDLFLSCPSKGYHGLYIELKRIKGGRESAEQKDWREKATKYGYKALLCKGAIEAIEAIKEYLR